MLVVLHYPQMKGCSLLTPDTHSDLASGTNTNDDDEILAPWWAIIAILVVGGALAYLTLPFLLKAMKSPAGILLLVVIAVGGWILWLFLARRYGLIKFKFEESAEDDRLRRGNHLVHRD